LSAAELAALADANDRACASRSLDAPLHHWRDGRSIQCRDWLAAALDELTPLAEELGLTSELAPLKDVLTNGNQSIRWLHRQKAGISIAELVSAGAREMAKQEERLAAQLNPSGDGQSATSHTDASADTLG
jgi:predicted glutamate--cysteine ligase